MPDIIYPSTLGFVWGIATPETGLEVSSFRQNNIADVFEQKNNVGEIVAVVSYNARAELTIEGEVTGTFTDLCGAPITVANALFTMGVATGLILCKSIEVTQGREAMKKVTINATMYPLIAVPTGS
jgi:hypothetical protein